MSCSFSKQIWTLFSSLSSSLNDHIHFIDWLDSLHLNHNSTLLANALILCCKFSLLETILFLESMKTPQQILYAAATVTLQYQNCGHKIPLRRGRSDSYMK